MFEVLVTMTPGRVGKPCECTIREKTGNVLTHLLSYLLHLMFVALWRKPVICRSPYGSLPRLTRLPVEFPHGIFPILGV